MKITYTARKVNLRDNFKERVEKKLAKFKKIFSEDAVAHVVVTLEKNRQTVEITIRDNRMVYRAESTQAEMNDALDRVIDILTRQIRKNKTRLEKRIKSGGIDALTAELPAQEEIVEDEYRVVRKKQISIKPVSVDEAILEMNMVNHDFFMFINAETDEVNVVYKREDGNYGVLEPALSGGNHAALFFRSVHFRAGGSVRERASLFRTQKRSRRKRQSAVRGRLFSDGARQHPLALCRKDTDTSRGVRGKKL